MTGDLAREPKQCGNTLWRSRGERPFLQGEEPRKGIVAFGKGPCEETPLRVEPRRRSRGIDQGSGGSSRLGNEARRRRVGSPNDGRHLGSGKQSAFHAQAVEAVLVAFDELVNNKAREAPRLESKVVTGVSEARSS